MSRVTARFLTLAWAALLLFPTLTAAQMTRGAISGTVRDASAALVPGAVVTVTNLDTNQSRSAVSDANGFYRVPALEPGTYKVRTELTGFQTVEKREVRLVAALEVTLNVDLKVGAMGEAITVVGESGAIELNKTSAVVGNDHDGAPGRRAAARRQPRHQQPDRRRAERGPHGRPGHVRRGRAALAQQQLHDRRLRQQRHERHDLDVAGRARGGGRVPGDDEPVQRRLRPQHRGPGQRDHQVRDQQLPRRGLGLLPDERPLLAHQRPEDPGPQRRPGFQAPPGGRQHRRADHQGQDVLLPPLPVRRTAAGGRAWRAHADADGGRLRGAFERAAAPRPAGREPPGGAAAALVPAGRLLAESRLQRDHHAARERRSDRARARRT